MISYLNSQTCIKRLPLEQRKCGLLRKVTYWKRLHLSEISAILGINFPEEGFSVFKFDLRVVSTTYSELQHT
jgi:hypothetical protein